MDLFRFDHTFQKEHKTRKETAATRHARRNDRQRSLYSRWFAEATHYTLCTLVASRFWRSPGRFREVTGKQRANRAPSLRVLTSFVRLANIWRKFREAETPQGVSPATPLCCAGVFIVSCDFYPLHLETEMHSFGDFSRSICVPVLSQWFGLRIRSDPPSAVNFMCFV